jgi:hypothetical protein
MALAVMQASELLPPFPHISGSQYRPGSHTGIQNPLFPRDIKVTFSARNMFRTAKSDVIFDFTINQPGSWEVVLNY